MVFSLSDQPRDFATSAAANVPPDLTSQPGIIAALMVVAPLTVFLY